MDPFEIVLFPDPKLRIECSTVTEITDELRDQLNRMTETMYQAAGIGLAAPQVGLHQRIIVVDVGHNPEEEKKGQLYQLINPEVVETEGQIDSEEGCLSIPGIRETVPRFERVVVHAYTPEEKEIRIEADGLLSICLQHEIDHLDGKLFIDYLSRVKRQLIKSKLKKIRESS